MNATICLVLFGVLITLSIIDGSPLLEEFEHLESLREKRSSGKVSLAVDHEKQKHGPEQTKVRAEYNHQIYKGKNGATVEAGAYAERNHGYGPKRDYGGQIQVKIPFKR